MENGDVAPAFSVQYPALYLFLACAAIAAGAHGLTACSPIPEDSPVLVIVNEKPITQSEFEYRWSELPPSSHARYRNEGGKRKFLDDLISRELLLQEARRLGLDQSPSVRERLERAKEQLALDELMRATVKARTDISTEELESYYTAHAAEVQATDQIHAAHIVVTTASMAWELKRQLDKGADFARLAYRFSLDQATKQHGGDLGPSPRGMLGPEIDAILQTLKPGMVSEPFETDAGFHLVKLISRGPGDAASRHAVLERLRHELYAEKQRQRFEELLSKLRATATIRMADASGLMGQEAGHPPDGPAP
jgi:peptidyl-prolyl cis-trans isomerase C